MVLVSNFNAPRIELLKLSTSPRMNIMTKSITRLQLLVNQMADYLRRDLVSHTRKVCTLYKKLVRDVEFWEELCFFEQRFKKLQVRAQFDKYKNLKDLREAKMMLLKGEKHLRDTIHPEHVFGQPMLPFSKNGIAYGREMKSPDWVMDVYHPTEKARYPYYFAKREQMKNEYINLWKKKMMRPGEDKTPDRS